MRAEYDFSKGKRGAILPTKGKTRITIYLYRQHGSGRISGAGRTSRNRISDDDERRAESVPVAGGGACYRVGTSPGNSRRGCGQGTAKPTRKRTRREASFCFASIPPARRLARDAFTFGPRCRSRATICCSRNARSPLIRPGASVTTRTRGAIVTY